MRLVMRVIWRSRVTPLPADPRVGAAVVGARK